MTYLSKGVIQRPSGVETIYVNRCGREHTLDGNHARLWLNGRFGIAEIDGTICSADLETLKEQGLIEANDSSGELAWYRILTNCVLCRAHSAAACGILGRRERQLWKWVAGAGFMLKISELVLLMEENIAPEPALLGKDNWQTLVDRIYTTETIFDGILDTAMELSPARNETVRAVLGLLRKKRILLL